MEKMNLKKFTHIPLLKNDAKLFFFLNVTNIHTEKKQSPKIFYKNKKHVPKKITSIKNKINYHAQALKNQKEKKIRKKERGNVNAHEKKKKKK